METSEKRLIISRIISGKVRFNGKMIDVPRLDVASEEIYNEFFQKATSEGCLTNDELLSFTDIPFDLDTDIAALYKKLSDEKLNLYMSRYNQGNIRKKIDDIREKIIEKYRKKNQFFEYSAESVATYARDAYYLRRYPNHREIMSHIALTKPTESQIREISRTDPWVSMSKIVKVRNPTDEYFELMKWTNIYKNISSHPESPENFVIEDDDLLDGWIVYISKKDKKGEARVQAGGSENFVLTQKVVRDEKNPDLYRYEPMDEGEIKMIIESNPVESKIAMAQRQNKIRKVGEVKEADLPDVRRELIMKRNRGG